MPEEITQSLRADGIDIIETTNLNEAAAKSDVLYMTRIQKERFPDPGIYDRLKGSYIVNNELITKSKRGITILHPLTKSG